jgi:GNAT superfamily N-acetyltransferase
MNPSIRQATPRDIPDIAGIHVAAWKAAYRGIVPQPFLDSLNIASRTEDWKTWFDKTGVYIQVAETDGELCGFIGGGALSEPIEGFDAEIYAIYLLPSAKGKGIGKLLMRHLAETLRVNGFAQVAVWVLAENPSRDFYQHLGGTQIAQKLIQIGGAELLEVAYGWPDIRTLANSTGGCP